MTTLAELHERNAARAFRRAAWIWMAKVRVRDALIVSRWFAQIDRANARAFARAWANAKKAAEL